MKYFIGIIVAALVVLGGWYYSQSRQAPVSSDAAMEQGSTGAPANPVAGAEPISGTPAPKTPTTPAGAVVAYTDVGFAPQTVTIKKGQSVTFVNKTSSGMWVASGPHPVHTAYDGTSRAEHCPGTSSFDQCATGDMYTFTFDKPGTWKYHNHVSSGDTGTVIVQ